jgi:type IV secretion system protein VirB3
MFLGVPLVLGAALMMLAALIAVIFKNPLYLGVMAPIWYAARELVARDYNAIGVWWVRYKAGAAFDHHTWGGRSVTPLPIRPIRNRGRGMTDVG